MQPIERLFKTELPAFDKDSVYQAVFYADGGAVPNPGFSGFGIHAYFFKEQKDTLKKPVIIANHFMEYFNTNPNAVSYSFVTSEGYKAYDQKTADKFKDKWVTPVCYFDKTVSFFWGKTERRDAEIIAVRAYSFIRFRWLDDENPREYFELKMTNNELTNDFVLEITDFTNADEANDLRELWESQVDTLRRTCGF
mgnify:CR=1 FL=1